MSHIYTLDNVTVDVSMLYEIAGNDDAYISRMIQTFLTTMPANIQKIDELYNLQDWDNLFLAAHSAKSTLSIIKVNDLHSCVQQIETNAKNKTSLDVIEQLINKVKKEYGKAEEILQARYPAAKSSENSKA